jgi:subtilisin family serine protease
VLIFLQKPDGTPLRGTAVVRLPGGSEVRGRQIRRGQIDVQLPPLAVPSCAVGIPGEPGYWQSACDSPQQSVRVTCESLPNGPYWWLDYLGLGKSGERGRGIRVGVIDTSFPATDDLEHFQDVSPSSAPMRNGTIGGLPHGEATCRLIGDRHFGGAAPEAGDYLYAAGADPTKVAEGILHLSEQHDVHIISLSWGSFGQASLFADVGAAVRRVLRGGTVCVVAAGNYRTPAAHMPAAFPASLAECVAVGALGARQWGSATSVTAKDEREAVQWEGAQHYVWRESAVADVNVLAPGVGLLVGRGGQPAFDVTGTSFAAPLVAGFLADRLSNDGKFPMGTRDAARSAHAMDALKRAWQALGLRWRP